MKFFWYVILFCLFTNFKKIISTKLLVGDSDFDNSNAWTSYAKEYIVFPKNYLAVLPLRQKVDLRGFILPNNGAILLQHDGSIDFGNMNKNDSICKNNKRSEVLLKAPLARNWYNIRNWLNIPNKLNENFAIPHLNKIPCDNEDVIIDRNGPLSIDLEKVKFLRVGQMNLYGTIITKQYFEYLLTTELGQLIFKNGEGISVEYYRNDVCGCHRDSRHLIEPVCKRIQDQCPIPHCLNPIVPLGNCCAICGAVLLYQVKNCNIHNIKQIEILISSKLKQHQLEDKIDSDVNFYNEKSDEKYLQIIVVDREEYDERSVKFLKTLNFTTDLFKSLYDAYIIREAYAGRHYNPHISFLSIFVIVICTLLVLFVLFIIFAHYQPNHQILQHVPIWLYDSRLWWSFAVRTQMIFARFDQQSEPLGTTSGIHEIEETLSVSANFITIDYNSERGGMHERSFDNPMFGNSFENLVLAGSNIEKTILPVLETGSLADMTASGKHAGIQELQEIILINSCKEGNNTEVETAQ